MKAKNYCWERGWWRVYFADYSLGGFHSKRIMHRWVEENIAGGYEMHVSHMRFYQKDDAVMCFLKWR